MIEALCQLSTVTTEKQKLVPLVIPIDEAYFIKNLNIYKTQKQ